MVGSTLLNSHSLGDFRDGVVFGQLIRISIPTVGASRRFFGLDLWSGGDGRPRVVVGQVNPLQDVVDKRVYDAHMALHVEEMPVSG